MLRRHGLLLRDRVPAAVRERTRHHGEILRRHVDGTLSGVDVGDHLWIVLDEAVGGHQRGDRLIALIRRGLRLVDLLVHCELAAREILQGRENLLPFGLVRRTGDHAGRRDRARVHERIDLMALVLLDRHDRVEDLPGGVHADGVLEHLGAAVLDHAGESENLGDRLDREERVGIADGVDASLGRDERDTEQSRRNFGERGDVVRVLALGDALKFRVRFLEHAFDRRFVERTALRRRSFNTHRNHNARSHEHGCCGTNEATRHGVSPPRDHCIRLAIPFKRISDRSGNYSRVYHLCAPIFERLTPADASTPPVAPHGSRP